MKRTKLQRGAALAEAAVTSVALFTLIMGAVEFGRAYNIYQNITNAAREGARYAVAPDPTTGALPSTTEIQNYVAPFLSSSSVSGTVSVAATSHSVNGVTTSYTQVTVSAPYNFFFFPFGTINMSANSEMRNETN
jgi:Flp pilus assembly protein TadG